MRIEGSGMYTDETGRSHRVLGVCELTEAKTFQELKISGKLSFEKVSCDEVSVSGKCEGGSITAQSMKVSGTCDSDSIIAKNFSVSGKVEVNSLTVEQTLRISGKPQIDFVTASEVIIATRSGFIGEVKCRKIRIFDETDKFVDKVFGKGFAEYLSSSSRVQVKNIEADTVALENCTVEVIRCKNAFIGRNCAIEKLFVASDCKIAADSTVGETVRT